MISNDCFYCGSPAKPFEGKCSKQYKWKRLFNHNGIDRMDNSIGYLPNNCVACCYPCNMAKGRMLHTDFLALVDRVYKHQNVRAFQAGGYTERR